MTVADTSSFTLGETITGSTSGATAILTVVVSTTVMGITIPSNSFIATETITGSKSGATTTVTVPTGTTGLDPTPVLANASDTGNGGGSADAAYQVTIGLDTSLTGNGWNAGTW